MSLLDPQQRSAVGSELQARLTASPSPAPATPVAAAWRDYIYAEVWSRPGLDLRARFFISLASAACTQATAATERYVRGALANELITLGELREAALHIAVYGGWGAGELLDEAVTRVADELGLPPVSCAPIREAAWDPAERVRVGQASFQEHMLFGGPPAVTAFFEGGILNFVFGEMWNRAGLDQRSRRWLTLVGVGMSSSSTPIRSHVWSAMSADNATREEMCEFVLQYAIHAGWPRASVMQSAVLEQAARVEKGLPFEV